MFKIENFEYNGFFGKMLPGYAPYTAEFIEWTEDPGIALCQCSDGKKRRIPGFAMEGDHETLPVQPKTGVLFGPPAHS